MIRRCGGLFCCPEGLFSCKTPLSPAAWPVLCGAYILTALKLTVRERGSFPDRPKTHSSCMEHLSLPPWNSCFAGAEGFFAARKGCFLAKHHSLPPHDLSWAGLIYWPPYNSKFWLFWPPWNSKFLYNQLFFDPLLLFFPKKPFDQAKKLRGEYPKPIHNINVHRLITQRNRPGTQQIPPCNSIIVLCRPLK